MSILKINLSAALLYFLGSYLGLQLVIAPSNASPIWPAAGIALVMLLRYGIAVVPGIMAGAFTAQLFSFIDYSSTERFIVSIGVALLLAYGSTLQAIIGRRLIVKYTGEQDPLVQVRSILKFMLLGGPLSCIVSASVGVLTLMASGQVPVHDALLTWATWWVGDSIGVLIFAPLLLILIGEPRQIWRPRLRAVAYPMLVLMVLLTVVFKYGEYQDQQRIKGEFDRQVNLFHQSISDSIDHHIQSNIALKAYFDSSETISEPEFDIFAETLLTGTHGVQALEWIPFVPHEARADFEENWLGERSILEPDSAGDMVPALKRDGYYPIRYVIPYNGNERALGFDVGSKMPSMQTISQARDTGHTIASMPLKLVQDTKQHIFYSTVFYSPVYLGKRQWESIEQRRYYFKGVVASVFRVGDEAAKTLKTFKEIQLYLLIKDQGKLLFSNLPPRISHDLRNVPLEKSHVVNVAGREWEFDYMPSREFFSNHIYWHLWWMMLGALLFTAFTGFGLLVLTGHTLQTEDLVRQRTLELQKEIRQRQLAQEERDKHNNILRSIVSTAPLHEILQLIIEMMEAANPEQTGSILLLDEDGRHIRHGAAPGLPDFYNQAIDGVEIGYGIGSCGTAMYSGKPVIVEDIENHPYWKDYLDLARRADIRACWSQPILDTEHRVIGSFAIYYKTVKKPTDEDLRRIEDLAQLASIAIERKRKEQQIQRLAFYDVLTDLPNRRLLLDRLEQQIASTTRHQQHGAILFIDLDNFKMLNDSLGHQVGDKLLIQVADRLRSCIREEDTAGRLGGDEFVILLHDTWPLQEKASEHVFTLAQSVLDELNKPYNLDGYLHHITPSIGITIFTSNSGNPDEVLKQADAAMYSAKARGRNTISFYHPDMQQYAHARLELEKDLRIALRENQFMMHYQPLFDSEMQVSGAEALLRWQHPHKGMINPGAFIHAAEECGLILPIGAWVLGEACRQLALWDTLPYISVNISPAQLQQVNFVALVENALRIHQVNPERLMLEMTEGSMISDFEDTKQKMEALQKLGIGMAIDDFGTGYSSLVYLKNLPIDQIKIDRGFVRDIETDANDKTIVETIIAMARHLRLQVVAEGVETQQQLEFLQDHGCDIYQGYYFSPPVPAHEFYSLSGMEMLQGRAAVRGDRA